MIQTTLKQRTPTCAQSQNGISYWYHLGDVMSRRADLPGDGVNIAARLESLAEGRRYLHFRDCL